MSGPLEGVRVIDLTTVGMGPYATQTLGDMGADIIKVEALDGDPFRDVAPSRHPKMGAAFLNLNRNKRSIALNLKLPEDKRAFLDLLDDADVFVTNTRPQALRKLGLDFETMSTSRPRLIYCSLNGFSERGPYAGKPAFDDIIQAMSGLAWLQGRNQGEPAYVNTILADKVAGLAAAGAIGMALFERERSGLGQSVEVPMFELMVSFTLIEHMAGATFIPPTQAAGYDRVLSPHRKPYRTSDGFVSLLPYTSAHWQRFFEAAGRPELASDPELIDPAARSRTIDRWYQHLAQTVALRTTAEWLQLASSIDVPIAPVLSPDDLLADPHLAAVGLFKRDDHPSEGSVVTTGIPITFSRTPGDIRRLAPCLNEHREEILEEPRGRVVPALSGRR
ncbi:CaiB/BaiF CoA transferase family protein [Rhizobium leguminosarum]|uniref:Acetyl-CoA acetyltransferase n=2 Tax=Rhizobium leguminosarum TaxID=384 RepID=A0A154IMC0_RHILE|nr:CoA transferase [Rhizobium leguminosarum]KZB01755.1 acetyl-CoA acetyltransferase [Rhizobium leguminosarum]